MHGEISFPVTGPAVQPAGGRGRALLAALCAYALSVALAPSPAAAQASRTAAAESLFNEGRELMKQGDFPTACEKFAASHALEASVGALLNLGDCRENNGQIASAWAAYRQAAAEARRAGDQRRTRVAQQHADRLEPTLSYLVIEVPDQARVAGLVVTRAGEVVEEPLWGQRAPVDPGEHEIHVQAPGHQPQSLRVTVAPGSKDASVSVPPLEKSPAMAEPDEPAAVPALNAHTGAGEPAHGRDDRGGLTTGRMVAIGGGVAGLAGVTSGVVFALRSHSKWDKAQASHCNQLDQCDPVGLSLAKQASDAATISNLSYGIGAVVLAGSVALWLLSPPEPGARRDQGAGAGTGAIWRPLAITPMVTQDRAGLIVEGRF